MGCSPNLSPPFLLEPDRGAAERCASRGALSRSCAGEMSSSACERPTRRGSAFARALALLVAMVAGCSAGSGEGLDANGRPLSEGVVTLDPIQDNTLCEDTSGSLSNGAGQHMFAGRTASGHIRRSALAFDIASHVPAGSTVNSVALTLHMSRTISGPQTIALYRLLVAWGEGISDAGGQEGSCTASTTGDATWVHTFWPTDFWITPGGDFSPTVSASQTVDGVGFYAWGPTVDMVADVQAWLDAPATNFGWLLLGDETALPTSKRFDTRENPELSQRPNLTINFTSP